MGVSSFQSMIKETSITKASMQDRYGPDGICFGCGPANELGLRIKSHRFPDEPYLKEGTGLNCDFQPAAHHKAFGDTINGGILGVLLDCHGNWTAAVALLDARGLTDSPDAEMPSTVTAHYSVRFLRPTPYGPPLRITSKVVSIDDPKVKVEMAVEAEGEITATGEGLFVAVEEGHPAHHRWE